MSHDHTNAVETILREWIADPDVAIVCGRWADGSIMELMPDGRANLAKARYEGRFAGLRDLELDAGGHHLHLDLTRLAHAAYIMAPSVCFGYRPSFELRLARDIEAARDGRGLAFAMRHPYRREAMVRDRVTRYFSRYADHRRRFPDVVSFSASLSPPAGEASTPIDWGALNACLAGAVEGARVVSSGEELQRLLAITHAAPLSGTPSIDDVVRMLDRALMLPDASLVIFRAGALVEFKTEQLRERVTRWVERDHVTWQIGSFKEHHCHLDLSAVKGITFDAEPVPCQGGRTNYTIWFIGEHDCGNPFRPHGLFSVTFNHPYFRDGTVRRDIVDMMYALYHSERTAPWVSASDAFLNAEPVAAAL